MSGEDEPGSDATIHTLKVFLQEVILISANVKVMLRTHHHKMDQTIVKPKPVQQHNIIKQHQKNIHSSQVCSLLQSYLGIYYYYHEIILKSKSRTLDTMNRNRTPLPPYQAMSSPGRGMRNLL